MIPEIFYFINYILKKESKGIYINYSEKFDKRMIKEFRGKFVKS